MILNKQNEIEFTSKMKNKYLLFFLLILIISVSCDKPPKQSCDLKTTYYYAKLNDDIKDLVDLYISTYSKISNEKSYLILGVHNYQNDEYLVRIDNIFKEQVGFNKNNHINTTISEYKGFLIYVDYDDRNILSDRKENHIDICYLEQQDLIIPDMYNGNPWEIHFSSGNVENVYFVTDDLKEKIYKIFKD